MTSVAYGKCIMANLIMAKIFVKNIMANETEPGAGMYIFWEK